MKKLLSVFVLLTFVGSMLVMTGCFGGDDDGIGAIIGAAVFVLAISATGGSGAAVFAANTRPSLRPAINYATANPTMIVYPLNLDGTKATATGYSIPKDKITVVDGNKFNAELRIQDDYTQYLVEIYASGTLITQGIQSVPLLQKTGETTKVNSTVNTTSTARTMLFNKWNTGAARRSYNDFAYNLNLSSADVNGIALQIDTSLNTWATTMVGQPNYTAADTTATTEVNKIGTTHVNVVSGFVRQVDGAGSSNAWVGLYNGSGQTQLYRSVDAENGYYLFEQVPNGTYRVQPSLPHHTFTPASYTITVTDSDVANLNFQAVAEVIP